MWSIEYRGERAPRIGDGDEGRAADGRRLVTVTATTASPPVAAVAVMEEASSSDIGVGGFISLLAGLDQLVGRGVTPVRGVLPRVAKWPRATTGARFLQVWHQNQRRISVTGRTRRKRQ